MKFYLGTDMPGWLWKRDVPLFVSARRLEPYKTLHPATCDWALDSGGFTELSKYGEWRTPPHKYIARVRRYADELGRLDFAAPQDWMCEPFMLEKTGLSVADHQRLTIDNYLTLRTLWPDGPVIPALQGWEHDDYLRHVEQYAAAGVDLPDLPLVGLGSVCRREATGPAEHLVHVLAGLGITCHGFGMKTTGLARYGALLGSADSMAWSMAARRSRIRLDGHTHQTCSHCPEFALMWRHKVLHPTRSSLWGITMVGPGTA